jgi:hypothetical protein
MTLVRRWTSPPECATKRRRPWRDQILAADVLDLEQLGEGVRFLTAKLRTQPHHLAVIQ